MMKKLFLMLLLSAAFLGGYDLGRRPDSPDIIGLARKKLPGLVRTTRELAAGIAKKCSESK